MRRQHPPTTAYPKPDGPLRAYRGMPPAALAGAALHTHSADARAALARMAGARSADTLVEAARAGATVPDLGWDALGELARVVALQDLRPGDRADGLALFDLLLRSAGAPRVSPAHQGLHVQLTFAAGDRDRTWELLAAYRSVPDPVRAALSVDLGRSDISTLLPAPGLTVPEGPGPAFDRIRSRPVQRLGSPHRVTTVVTTYRPGPALLTTVRSLVAQSWTNQEILVVDDGSGAEHDAILSEVAALDPRVRVLRLPVNGGTYVARNAALDAATGEFVTFQDADDWSHPLRLERQALALLADPSLVATTTVGMRVTEELVVTRPGWEQSRSYNLSSLMLRRRVVLDRLGYLDPVRKGADAEYVERARAVFGRPAVRHLTGAPLALIRLSSGSLSASDIRAGWMHPARRAYLSAFQEWHRRVADGEAEARRPARPLRRAYAVPRRLAGDAADRPVGYDVILAGDWTTAGGAAEAGLGQLRALAGRGMTAALAHLDVLDHLAGGAGNLDPLVQRQINAGEVEQVMLDDRLTARLVVVQTPGVLRFAPGDPGEIRAGRVVVQTAAARRPPPYDVCADAARRLFGVEPLWAPAGPADRRAMGAGPVGTALAPADLPATVDVHAWRMDRRGPRSDRPVVGRMVTGDRAGWRRLLGQMPASARLDVRLLDTGDAAERAPRAWLVYRPEDVDLRGFLDQIDFYLHLPADDASRDADPALLTALAAGCVLVLPHRYAPTFGDAAIYCAPDEITATVRRMHRRPAVFREQSARGREFVRQRHRHERFAERVTRLL
ncbi:glycosyltransferase family A protein [Mangrovihabitans endophyticus]|uniref:Glycosyltransferase 2-like domain-containing protein n=1 Tax=Mangrovihabitans endophyticus TaxID=1751298 RepID=A0A8J3FNS9_9ACTN|nr:glycosyltransferase family A protein [Mangrovihabitans endophyticus]GGK89654.1 hypothetical protein GCM10012284_24500 [Mangrovihabitans endophyticus]